MCGGRKRSAPESETEWGPGQKNPSNMGTEEVWIVKRVNTAQTMKSLKSKESIHSIVSLIVLVTSCTTTYLEWWGGNSNYKQLKRKCIKAVELQNRGIVSRNFLKRKRKISWHQNGRKIFFEWRREA